MVRNFPIIFFAVVLCMLTSCATQNLFTSQESKSSVMQADSTFKYNPNYQYTIRKDDKITISVWDHEELSIGSIYGIYNSNEVYGKWAMVDADGKVLLPKIGKVKLLGLALTEAKDSLLNEYKKWIVNPIIEIKVLNKEVTVLGELKTPGKYVLEKDNNQLLDIIGKAGDFDLYANKKQVQVIRMVNNQSKMVTVDLTKMDNFISGNIQIQPGDVIYVPSRKGKHWDKRAGSTIVPVASAISTAVLLARLIF